MLNEVLRLINANKRKEKKNKKEMPKVIKEFRLYNFKYNDKDK